MFSEYEHYSVPGSRVEIKHILLASTEPLAAFADCEYRQYAFDLVVTFLIEQLEHGNVEWRKVRLRSMWVLNALCPLSSCLRNSCSS